MPARQWFAHRCRIEAPTPLERRALLRYHLAESGVTTLSDAAIDRLADRCHGMLPVDVRRVVLEALRLAAMEADDDDDDDGVVVSVDVLERARLLCVPSTFGNVTITVNETNTNNSNIDNTATNNDNAESNDATTIDNDAAIAGLDAARRAMSEALTALGGRRRALLAQLGAHPPHGVLL
jgi:hypothetical protein